MMNDTKIMMTSGLTWFTQTKSKFKRDWIAKQIAN